VIGFRVMGRFLTGYGGRVAPPFNRIYMGGEQDVRGFEIWGISPVAWVPSEATINVLNADGSARQQKVIVNGKQEFVAGHPDHPHLSDSRSRAAIHRASATSSTASRSSAR
jgi:outer membrane protein assembly factor BamA